MVTTLLPLIISDRNNHFINFLTSYTISYVQAFTGSIVEHPVNLPMNPGQQSGTTSQVELPSSFSFPPTLFLLLWMEPQTHHLWTKVVYKHNGRLPPY